MLRKMFFPVPTMTLKGTLQVCVRENSASRANDNFILTSRNYVCYCERY